MAEERTPPAWVETGEEPDIDHVLRAHSANRAALRGHLALYRAVMFDESPLTRSEREAVGVAVSAANECHY